jgi:hypothetical protein
MNGQYAVSGASPHLGLGSWLVRRLLALYVVALLSGCDIFSKDSEGWIEKVPNRTVMRTTDYNLQNCIPVPASGEKPVFNFTRPDMIVTATWTDGEKPLDGNDVFAQGKIYEASITLTAQAPYSFDPKIPFAYPQGAVESETREALEEDQRQVSVRYKPIGMQQPLMVADYNLANYVPIPVAGQTSVGSLERGDMRITVEWKEGANPFSGTFEVNRVYSATITLTAKTDKNYFFDGSILFKYDPPLVVEVTPDLGVEARTITATYPATTEVQAPSTPSPEVPVVDYDLQHYVPIPVVGEIPVRNPRRGDMNLNVAWTPNDQRFQADTVYTAIINLAAKGRYKFDTKFAYDEGFVASQDNEAPDLFATSEASAISQTVTVTYSPTPKLPAPTPTAVMDYDLQHYVPIPVVGGIPVRALSRADMDLRVDWRTNDNQPFQGQSFEAGTVYRATITLNAAEGYKFTRGFVYGEYFVAGQTNGAPESFATSDPSATEQTVTVTYNPTPESPKALVTDYRLQNYVPIPALGNSPVIENHRADVDVTVAWKWGALGESDKDNYTPCTGSFAFFPDRQYMAVITITAKDGYTFLPDTPFAYNPPEDVISCTQEQNDGDTQRTITVDYLLAQTPGGGAGPETAFE